MEECIYESLFSQEVSIQIQGAYHYLRHSRQDIYLSAIYGRDFSFCGDPAEARWEALNGFTTIPRRTSSPRAKSGHLLGAHATDVPPLQAGRTGDNATS